MKWGFYAMSILKQILFALLVCTLLRCSSSGKDANIITTPDEFATYDTIPQQYATNIIESNVSSSNFSNNIMPIYGNTEADTLEQEYQSLSREIEALQSEFKATINTQMVAQDYLVNPSDSTARRLYEKKMGVLLKIRRENQEKGLPSGPYIGDNHDISWVVETLKKNYDILSDQISDLKKKKGKVATKQLLLKAKGK